MKTETAIEMAAPHDPEFAGPIAKGAAGGRPGWFVAGLAVAVGLYLPFAFIPAGLNNPNDWWHGWILFWPILPGFAPGAWLAHPRDGLVFAVAGVTTFGLLAGLTWLGSAGGWRLAGAVILAFLVSIPTALLVQACIAF